VGKREDFEASPRLDEKATIIKIRRTLCRRGIDSMEIRYEKGGRAKSADLNKGREEIPDLNKPRLTLMGTLERHGHQEAGS